MSDTMSDSYKNIIDRASTAWFATQRLDAGRLLFEAVPEDSRPKWASSLLKHLVIQSGVRHAAVATMLHVADHPEKWGQAHSVFSVIRRFGLDMDRIQQKSKQQQVLVLILVLAELVAKVTYNATKPPDPFDHDAGWSIAACFKAALDLITESDASQLAWDTLSAETMQA